MALCIQEAQVEYNLTGGREQCCLNQRLLFWKMPAHLGVQSQEWGPLNL